MSPPRYARNDPALAQTVAALGFRGLYVDGNAVAPETAREIGRVVEGASARFVVRLVLDIQVGLNLRRCRDTILPN